MKRRTYNGLAAIMEPWLYASTPRLYRPAMVPQRPVAVYVGLIGEGTVAYVGSVCRRGDPDALVARLREHRAIDRWNWVVVFSLRDDTPSAIVLEFEGMVGRLLLPTQNRRLPSTWLPAAPRARRVAAESRLGGTVRVKRPAGHDLVPNTTPGGTDVR